MEAHTEGEDERRRLEGIEVASMPLSRRTFLSLRSKGIERLGQVLEARRMGTLPRMAAKNLAELEIALEPYVDLWHRALPGRGYLRTGSLRSPGPPRSGRRRGSRRHALNTKLEAHPGPAPAVALNPEESIFGQALSGELAGICRATPIPEIRLSPRAKSVAMRLAWVSVLDIALAPTIDVLKLKNCGKRTITELHEAVVAAIRDASQEPSEVSVEPAALRETIDGMLSSLDERESFVLRERWGLWDGTDETLEDIGSVLGVTRERVRQIEKTALIKLRESSVRKLATRVMAKLGEELLHRAGAPDYFGVLTQEELVTLFETPRHLGDSDFAESERASGIAYRFLKEALGVECETLGDRLIRNSDGRHFISEAALRRFEETEGVLRSLLISKGRPVVIGEVVDGVRQYGLDINEREIERVAETSSTIGIDWTNSVGLRRWKFFRRRSVIALAQRALTDLGAPSHASRVAEKVSALWPGTRSVDSHAVTAGMLRYPNVFVSLGRGMYGLRDWGIVRPPYLKDFLAEAIRRRDGKAHVDELTTLGAERYGFKRSSISMTLAMNPHLFRDLGKGVYAVR